MDIKVQEINKKTMAESLGGVTVFTITLEKGDRVATMVLRQGNFYLISGHVEVRGPDLDEPKCVHNVGSSTLPKEAEKELFNAMIHWLNGETIENIQKELFSVKPDNIGDYRTAVAFYLGTYVLMCF